eukprot:NODE_7196_length_784_cov_88.751891_g6956_i0.p1 GENE.NODE_7196_length_784_cov_88.751891_g6956_i0~~NODE_7196_length_784_cov_88.751891_g6956_i0.p1  ORF type:complete len:120 (-),score=29.13 NODE_7196_length_784_cov_88.751891_g6956_i0:97-456(-)
MPLGGTRMMLMEAVEEYNPTHVLVKQYANKMGNYGVVTFKTSKAARKAIAELNNTAPECYEGDTISLSILRARRQSKIARFVQKKKVKKMVDHLRETKQKKMEWQQMALSKRDRARRIM